MTEDEKAFGERVWVYCDQHLRPHMTGWCTVASKNKTLLQSTTPTDAEAECKAKGFKLYTP